MESNTLVLMAKKSTRKRKIVPKDTSTKSASLKKVCRSKNAKSKPAAKGPDVQSAVTSNDPTTKRKEKGGADRVKSMEKIIAAEPVYDFPLSQASKYIPTFGKKAAAAATRKIEKLPLLPVEENHSETTEDVVLQCIQSNVGSIEEEHLLEIDTNEDASKVKIVDSVVESVAAICGEECAENADIAMVPSDKYSLEKSKQEDDVITLNDKCVSDDSNDVFARNDLKIKCPSDENYNGNDAQEQSSQCPFEVDDSGVVPNDKCPLEVDDAVIVPNDKCPLEVDAVIVPKDKSKDPLEVDIDDALYVQNDIYMLEVNNDVIVSNDKCPLEENIKQVAEPSIREPPVNNDRDIGGKEKTIEMVPVPNEVLATGEIIVPKMNEEDSKDTVEMKLAKIDNADSKQEESCAVPGVNKINIAENFEELEKAIIEELTEEEEKLSGIESTEQIERTNECALVAECVDVVQPCVDECSSSIEPIGELSEKTGCNGETVGGDGTVNKEGATCTAKESDETSVDAISSNLKGLPDSNLIEKCTSELKSALDDIKLTDSQLCEFDSEMLPPELPSIKTTHPIHRPLPTVMGQTKNAESSPAVKQLISELSSINQMLIRYRHDIQQMKLKVQKGQG